MKLFFKDLFEANSFLLQQLENRDSSFENVLEDMEVMSDFELHNLCREKYYLRKYSMETEALLNSGKFSKLDELLPELKEKVCFDGKHFMKRFALANF